MTQQVNPRRLNQRREKAAQLISDDFLSDEKIAEIVGVKRRTLARWKSERAFAARVEVITEAYNERALKHNLARRERRLTVLTEAHDKLLRIIDERAADPELQDIPGGKTGLVTKTLKGIGKGDDYQVVQVYEVDTGILKEIRAIHERVAEELGQTRPLPVNVNLSGALDLSSARERLLAKLASEAPATETSAA